MKLKRFFQKKKNLSSNQVKRRFVKDYNLPISIVDEPYFSYYMKLYEWFPRTEYYETLYEIEKDGSENSFLEKYAKIRDNIITTVENSEAYKEFNNGDMEKYKITTDMHMIGDVNIYNHDSIGKKFFSIDLKKANFQALRYVNPEIVRNTDTYDDFIRTFSNFPYISKSKYTRQVIFGKLNPKRTIAVEKYMMSKVYEFLKESFRWFMEDAELVAFKSDELIFQVSETVEFNEITPLLISDGIYDELGIDVHCEYFRIGIIETKNSNGISVDAYIKSNLINHEETLKSASMIYYPQFYKFLHGMKINKKDLVFMSEGQPARFMNKLELVRIVR